MNLKQASTLLPYPDFADLHVHEEWEVLLIVLKQLNIGRYFVNLLHTSYHTRAMPVCFG
jgi:hypothetical protein